MDDATKYLIHANFTADGVVERNDVVGAIFGQTEGLLGEDLDLHHLQDHSKVGRIDVDVDTRHGQAFGTITIASGLDRVETAVLAAGLETIEQVGPCSATIEVADIEDVRRAKRRQVVDRASELLAEFEADALTSTNLVDAVQQKRRTADITEYEGLPAGPRVADSDAIVVVEGRADVLRLLECGVKNAVAVEGTDVPDAVADLTRDRTTTAFFDGDRGGELILRELEEVGSVDHVATPPGDRAVEDLTRAQVLAALRAKTPADARTKESGPQAGTDPADDAVDAAASAERNPSDADDPAGEPTASTDGSGAMAHPDAVGATGVERRDGRHTAGPEAPETVDGPATRRSRPPDPDDADRQDGPAKPSTDADSTAEQAPASVEADSAATDDAIVPTDDEGDLATTDDADASAAADDEDEPATEDDDRTPTLGDHVRDVVEGSSEGVRLLDADAHLLAAGDAADARDLLEATDGVASVVVDGPATQALLDVAAQRGVERVCCAEEGEYVKQPAGVRVSVGE